MNLISLLNKGKFKAFGLVCEIKSENTFFSGFTLITAMLITSLLIIIVNIHHNRFYIVVVVVVVLWMMQYAICIAPTLN